MKVVRVCDERDYKEDGNRIEAHRLQFKLVFDSPTRGPIKLAGHVDIRRSAKECTVGAIRLTFPSKNGAAETHKELSTGYEMSLDELIEFADGLKAAAVVAQDLFKVRPPVQAQSRPCSCVCGRTACETPGADTGNIGSAEDKPPE